METGPLTVPEADPVTGPVDIHSVRVAVANPPCPPPVPSPREQGPATPWLFPVTKKIVKRRLAWLRHEQMRAAQNVDAV